MTELPALLAALLAETRRAFYPPHNQAPWQEPRHDPATIAATLRAIAEKFVAQYYVIRSDERLAREQAACLREWASLVEAEAARRTE